MKKIRKLLRSPYLFFSDLIAKKKGLLPKQAGEPTDYLLHNPDNFQPIYHLIHLGETIQQGPSQLGVWLSAFINSKQSFLILVRHQNLYAWLVEKYPHLNIAYARHPSNINNLLATLPHLKAIYYLSNTGNLIHTLIHNQYTHIFLGHGDSDKAASAHKFFRVYDQIWVAGDAHKDRLINAGFNIEGMEFVKVGRPALKDIIQQSHKSTPVATRAHILYLPTWEGVYEENNYSSVSLCTQFLPTLQTRYSGRVSAKFHPATGSRLSSLRAIKSKLSIALCLKWLKFGFLRLGLKPNHFIASSRQALSPLIQQADVFICDISAVVSECIAANKPIFVYIPSDKDIKKSSSKMDYADYTYVYSTPEELYKLYERVVIKGDDYLKAQRTIARDYLISVAETCNDAFSHQLRAIAYNTDIQVTPRPLVTQ